jgi:hypothetical protein
MVKTIMHLSLGCRLMSLGCRLLFCSFLIVPAPNLAVGFEQPGSATDVPLPRAFVHRGFEIDTSLLTGRHNAESLEAPQNNRSILYCRSP